MQNKMWKKELVIGLITLFFITGVFPSVSGNIIIEKNKQDVVDNQKLDNSYAPFIRTIIRTYFFGPIYNLTYDENEGNYEFESNNIRYFRYVRYDIHSWGFSYEHFMYHSYFSYGGFGFRGILKPTFIFGYFYVPRQ